MAIQIDNNPVIGREVVVAGAAGERVIEAVEVEVAAGKHSLLVRANDCDEQFTEVDLKPGETRDVSGNLARTSGIARFHNFAAAVGVGLAFPSSSASGSTTFSVAPTINARLGYIARYFVVEGRVGFGATTVTNTESTTSGRESAVTLYLLNLGVRMGPRVPLEQFAFTAGIGAVYGLGFGSNRSTQDVPFIPIFVRAERAFTCNLSVGVDLSIPVAGIGGDTAMKSTELVADLTFRGGQCPPVPLH